MHVKKLNNYQIGQMLAHVTRDRKDGRYSNKQIDATRSHLNFEVSKKNPCSMVRAKIENAKRISEATTGKKTRRDAIVAVSVVITLPERYKAILSDSRASDALRQFFNVAGKATLDNFNIKSSDYILASVVHMDETTPHMHLWFVPLMDGRLNAKKLISRKALSSLHNRVDTALRDGIPWYTGGIILSDEERLQKGSVNNQKQIMQVHKTIQKEKALIKAGKEVLDKAKQEILVELKKKEAKKKSLGR